MWSSCLGILLCGLVRVNHTGKISTPWMELGLQDSGFVVGPHEARA